MPVIAITVFGCFNYICHQHLVSVEAFGFLWCKGILSALSNTVSPNYCGNSKLANERWSTFTLDVGNGIFLLCIAPDGEKHERIRAMHIGHHTPLGPDEVMGVRRKHGFHRFDTWKSKYFFNGGKSLGTFPKRITSDSYELHHWLRYALDTRFIPDDDGGYFEIYDDRYLNY
eukprot:gene780-929_t